MNKTFSEGFEKEDEKEDEIRSNPLYSSNYRHNGSLNIKKSHDIITLSPFEYTKIKRSTVQCNLDLVTLYLVTNRDLVTILQKTIFLVHKHLN